MGRERGLALISVLWGLIILSLIAAAMLAATSTSTRIDRNSWSAARADTIADAAINRAILALLDKRPSGRWRIDGTRQSVDMQGATSDVWIQDEAGKIDLNTADPALLQGLLQSVDIDSDVAGNTVSLIVARRQKNSAPGALAFHSVEDVMAIPGIADVFSRIEPALTVYSRASSIDTAVAPREALLAMPEMDGQKVSEVIAARDKAYSETLASTGATGPVAQSGHRFMITAETTQRGAHVVRKAIVLITGDPAQPFLVLNWQ